MPAAPLTLGDLGQLAVSPGPQFSYLCNEGARLEKAIKPPRDLGLNLRPQFEDYIYFTPD